MLKGHTTIELTDVNDGTTEVIEENNLVTKALESIFNDRNFGISTQCGGIFDSQEKLSYTTSSSPSSNQYKNPYNNIITKDLFSLVYKNLLGGLVLFSKKHEENANKIIADTDNEIVGYANQSTNTGTDIKYGSINTTESGEITNGYKFVWDFATSQGNGTIASLSLTSDIAGVNFYNPNYEYGSFTTRDGYFADSYYSRACPESTYVMDGDFVNSANGEVYSIVQNYVETKIKIYRVDYYRKSMAVMDKNKICLLNNTLMKTIEPKDFILNTHSQFFDGKDGYWYGYCNNANSAGNATVYWIKISREDYSFTEGSFVLQDVQLANISLKGRGGYGTSTSYSQHPVSPEKNMCIHNGFLYILGYTRDRVFKIKKSDTNIVSEIILPSKIAEMVVPQTTYNSFYGVSGATRIIEDIDCVKVIDAYTSPKVYAITDADVLTVLYTGTSYIDGLRGYVEQKKGLWGLRKCVGSNGDSSCFGYALFPTLRMNYLATINNLSSPVTKTADKTMKITYTVTEA